MRRPILWAVVLVLATASAASAQTYVRLSPPTPDGATAGFVRGTPGHRSNAAAVSLSSGVVTLDLAHSWSQAWNLSPSATWAVGQVDDGSNWSMKPARWDVTAGLYSPLEVGEWGLYGNVTAVSDDGTCTGYTVEFDANGYLFYGSWRWLPDGSRVPN